ncbi:MAG: Spx/MgsR family RNA polymerase-binding regulatory protein [Sulfurimonas sp.]
MIQIYGIKNCDSVKSALKFFKEHKLDYTLHDFKTDPVSCNKVSFWLKSVQLKKILNARSTTYRNLKLKEKNLTQEEQINYLCKENLLIKRPVVEFESKVMVGFDKEMYQGVFL